MENDHSKWPLFLWRHCFHDKLFKYILFSHRFREGFRSVVVITSALHAEGRRFEPCRNQLFFFLCDIFIQILPWIVLPNDLEHADKEKNILKPRSSFGRLELIWSGCTDTIMFFSLYLFYNIDIKMWNFSDVDIEPDIDFVMTETLGGHVKSSLLLSPVRLVNWGIFGRLSLWKFEVFMTVFTLDYPFFGRLLLPNFVVFQCYSISFREKRAFEWFKKIC